MIRGIIGNVWLPRPRTLQRGAIDAPSIPWCAVSVQRRRATSGDSANRTARSRVALRRNLRNGAARATDF